MKLFNKIFFLYALLIPLYAQSMVVNSSTLLNLLISTGLIEQFGQDVYLKTDNLKLRNINDQPDFLWYYEPCNDRFLNFKIAGFYNKTNHMFFSNCSDRLSSYVNFNNADFAQSIAQAIPVGGQTPAVVFAALRDTKLSAQKAGVMLQAKVDCRNLCFQLQMPVYQIKLKPLLTPAGKKLSNSFENGPIHGLCSWGAGDIKGKLSFPVICNNCAIADLGLIFSLPTKKYVSRIDSVATIDLNRILSLAVLPSSLGGSYIEAFNQLEAFLLTGKNYLNNMILTAGQLGNYGHFTVGAMGHFAYQPCDYFAFKAYAEAQCFLPRKELRYFLKKKKQSDFTASNFAAGLSNEALATQDLALLSRTLEDMLFPSQKCFRIKPRYTFEVTLEPHFYWREFDLIFGYDFWHKQGECIAECDLKKLQCFNVGAALTPCAYQHKLFGGLSYLLCDNCADLEFCLRASGAIKSQGIGKDFSVIASLTASF